MKNLWVIGIIITLILTVGACSNASLDTSNKIVAPDNETIPLFGSWEIEKCLTNSPTGSLWTGKAGEFTADTAVLGENYWENVNYKVKRVNAEEYFLYKYSGSIEELGIKDREIFIITVSSTGNFLYEFVKINDNKVIVDIEDDLFFMKKVSDEVKADVFVHSDGRRDNGTSIARYKGKLSSTGILLGIRTSAVSETEADNEPGKYNYRTLWIAAENRNLHQVLEADDIFLPRKSGFWKLEVKEVTGNGITQDVPMAYSVFENSIESLNKISEDIDFWEDRQGVLRKKILYVGNDYACVENSGMGQYRDSSEEWEENHLRTFPVDNILNSQGVKISDIAGDNGLMAMENGMSDLLSTSNSNIAKEVLEDKDERSFALFRKTGHWYTKGRLNLRENAQVPFIDFNIHLIPPAEMVAYDIFQMSWTYLKDRIPDAVDAYTSPNEDIALVLTGSELLVYALHEGELEDVPLQKISLHEGDSVVMAEWATGDYVEKWENAFKKSNEVRELTSITPP